MVSQDLQKLFIRLQSPSKRRRVLTDVIIPCDPFTDGLGAKASRQRGTNDISHVGHQDQTKPCLGPPGLLIESPDSVCN